jgi:hypothetical protein
LILSFFFCVTFGGIVMRTPYPKGLKLFECTKSVGFIVLSV